MKRDQVGRGEERTGKHVRREGGRERKEGEGESIMMKRGG